MIAAFAPVQAASAAVIYSAGIEVTPNRYRDGDTPLRVGYDPFDDSPRASPIPVSYRLTHQSATGTGTIGNTSATPDNGGTVRVTASTIDEVIYSQASIGYSFRLVPKIGAVLPEVVPLHVFALGGTGTEDYAAAGISFILNYSDGARSTKAIVESTGVVSNPREVVYNGGNGNIRIDDNINVFWSRDLQVNLFAAARAGAKDALGRPQAGTASAYLDPVFTLPAAYRDLIDIVGVPQGDVLPPPPGTGAVPEPATWAMMIIGFGAVGAQMRRRQRTGVSFA